MIKKINSCLLLSVLECLLVYVSLFFILITIEGALQEKAIQKKINLSVCVDQVKAEKVAFLNLTEKQKKVLEIFSFYSCVSARQMSNFFNWTYRCCTRLCQIWTKKGFFEIADSPNKTRTYRLSKEYQKLFLNGF